jgi:hypothetical protein
VPESDQEREYDESSMHTIRPRWIWIGLACLLLGLATTGVGIMTTSLAVVVPGVVVLALGAASALHGGLYYDTRGQTGGVLKSVREDPHYEEPGPEASSHDQEAQERSEEVDETRRRALTASMRTPMPLLPVGAVLMLVVCVWLVVTQGSVYPTTSRGQSDGLRDMGVAIVVALGSLRLLVAGRQVWISGVMVLAGACTLVPGLVVAHGTSTVTVSEAMSGALIILGALLTLDRRSSARTPSGAGAETHTTRSPQLGGHAELRDTVEPAGTAAGHPPATGRLAVGAGLAAAVAVAVRVVRRTPRS